ncbi:MAG: hypothetical protein ACKV2Q_20255 [Planctomycetaceae bacterium]
MVSLEDVAVSECVARADGRDGAAPSREVLAAALGLSASSSDVWTTGPVAGEVRHFRVVFKRPVSVGTICSRAETVAVLKDGAALPGDLADDSQWVTLTGGMARALPKQTAVRAIRVTLRHHNLPWEAGRQPSVFPGLWLLKGRFFNPTDFGRRDWAAVVNEDAKQKHWEWLGYWPATRPVAGVLIGDRTKARSDPIDGVERDPMNRSERDPMNRVTTSDAMSIRVLPARATTETLWHPRAAKVADWKSVKVQKVGGVLAFDPSVATHAVRLVTNLSESKTRVNDLPDVMPLVALGDDDVAPSSRSFSFIEPAPVSLSYQNPIDGFVAVRIEDSAGKHVRRLVAEVERDRGEVRESWDLRDDAGKLVTPGSYRFVGLARPPLKLTYEMTVYNAGSPPWMAPVAGGGWWMADHSPPTAVCSVKDVLFFGAFGAEFGTPLIATDREGKKLWHDLHQGVERLVSDGRYAYVVNKDQIVRIDPEQQFAKQVLHRFEYSDKLPGHSTGYVVSDRSGAAVHDGLLCVSYSGASPPWIQSAVKGDEIDLDRCFPRPLPRKVHETALTPNELVFSTLQTMTSSTAAMIGPAPKRGPFAGTLIVTLKHEVPIGSVVLPQGDLDVWALRPGKKLPAAFVPPDTPIDEPQKTEKPTDDLVSDVLGDLESRFDPAVWVRLKGPTKLSPSIAVPEAGLMTRVLVFTSPTLRQLDYGMLLDRRYRNATSDAKFIALEGQTTEGGGWQIRRSDKVPLSFGNPAIAGYVWPEPRSLRGFLLTRPLEWAGFTVDVWKGAEDGVIDAAAFRNDELWREVHRHHQTRNHIKFSWHTNRVIVGDFADSLSVRAIRIRVVEPPNGAGYRAAAQVSGGFESFLTFEPIGNDAVLPKDLAQRVTVLELPKNETASLAKVLGHIPLGHPSAMTFDRAGRLLIACDDGIVRLNVAESLRESGDPSRDSNDPSRDRQGAVPGPNQSPLPNGRGSGSKSGSGSESDAATIIPLADAGRPRAIAFDQDGLLYLLDGAKQRVRVFDLESKQLVREFGQPGGAVGPYDSRELSVPVAMAFDAADKLWLVEQHFQPKRISRWSKIGEVEKQLFGPTHYGGGGMLDSRDKTVINHLGMKFRIDHATRTWKLESRLAAYGCGHFLPDRVVYQSVAQAARLSSPNKSVAENDAGEPPTRRSSDEHRFLVGDRPTVTPFGDAGPISVICYERNGVAVPIVASGVLGDWKEFSHPKQTELRQLAKEINPADTAFVWSDLNHDTQVQAAEVQLLRGFTTNRAPYIGDDLSLNFARQQGGARLRVQSLNGKPEANVAALARVRSDDVKRADDLSVPRYDVSKLEHVAELTDQVWVSSRGETLVMSHKLLGPDGQLLWTYPDNYRGVQASNQTPWGFYNRPPGVIAGSFGLIGQFDIAGESLFCVGGNNGDYYAITKDGLLAAAILGGPRGYGRRFFSIPDCVPGQTDLSDLRKTVEDFHGHVTRAEDGHVYAIAGKNHVSLIRVDGLEQMQRFNGSVEVTRDDLTRTQDWATTKTRLERFLDDDGSKRITVPQFKKTPTIDGDVLTDWPDQPWVTVHTSRNAQGKVIQLTQSRLAFDAEHLYVAATTLDQSPLVNSATDPGVLFQHGDAFDLHLGLDPQATPGRNDPAPGDVRVLISANGETPVVMLYRYVDPTGKLSSSNTSRVFRSPVGETPVAALSQLANARVAIVRTDKGWTIEAALPWKSLGTTAPKQTVVLGGDLGILESDPNGQSTVGRFYWSNKKQVTLGDQPAEARVSPSLWGEFEFLVPDALDGLLDP